MQIDTARANDLFFVNNISIGLYPELVARREERGRDYPRWKARLYAAYMTLRKYPHVSFTVETEHHQEVIRTHVFMVSNNSYDLSRIGIEAPRSMMTEGRLTVYWLPHLPRMALMRFAAHYLAGRVTTTPGFRMFRTARMKVKCEIDEAARRGARDHDRADARRPAGVVRIASPDDPTEREVANRIRQHDRLK